jgi:glutathione peroxidase-family protein
MNLENGDLVVVNMDNFPIFKLTGDHIGFVYDEYQNNGVSILLLNGEDLGGFSEKDQELFVYKICKLNFHYNFLSSTTLIMDYQNGLFDSIIRFVKRQNEVRLIREAKLNKILK